MTPEFIVLFCGSLIGVLVIDIVIVKKAIYEPCVKEGRLLRERPSWKDTKKPKAWILTWSISVFLNNAILLGVSLYGKSVEHLYVAVFFSGLVYPFIWMAVYSFAFAFLTLGK